MEDTQAATNPMPLPAPKEEDTIVSGGRVSGAYQARMNRAEMEKKDYVILAKYITNRLGGRFRIGKTVSGRKLRRIGRINLAFELQRGGIELAKVQPKPVDSEAELIAAEKQKERSAAKAKKKAVEDKKQAESENKNKEAAVKHKNSQAKKKASGVSEKSSFDAKEKAVAVANDKAKKTAEAKKTADEAKASK